MDDCEKGPVGEVIDSLGIKIGRKDGDMVTDVVVLAKIVEADGKVRFAMAWSEGTSWIERFGMVAAAFEGEKPNVQDMQ